MKYMRINLVLASAFLAGLLLLAAPPQIREVGENAAAGTADAPALLSSIRQLTFEGRRAGEGYFDRNASKMVFQSERETENPFFQIYLLDLETGDTHRISPGWGKTTCGWIHPRDERVLFASTHHDPDARAKQKEEFEARASGSQRRYSWDFDPYFDLYSSDYSGQQLVRLTDSWGYDAEASWSPNGSKIVFSSNRHAYANKATLSRREQELLEKDPSYFLDLYLMNSDGSGLRRLTAEPGYDGGPFFSFDGGLICWRRFSEDGSQAEIYVMDADGGNPRQVTELSAMSWAPFFHPSGDYLIFSNNLNGFSNFELYLVDTAGTAEPIRVTVSEGFDGLPVFSPDGNMLSWTSNRTSSGQSQIFLAEWNHALARELLGLSSLEKTAPDVLPSDLRLHVERLASNEMEGRLTGTEGAYRASAYLASYFSSLGLEPADEDGDYFQEFEFTSGVSTGEQNRLIMEDGESPRSEFTIEEDWRPLAFTRTGEISLRPVVFAGYGIVAPAEGDHPEYDSYVHLDVTDSWVMVFRYLPENISQERRQHLSRYASLRYKAMVARDRGAVGIIFVSGPQSQVKDELIPLRFDAAASSTTLAAIAVTDSAAQRLLSPENDLASLQQKLDSGDPLMGFPLSSLKLGAYLDIRQEKRTGRNVLARLGSKELEGKPMIVLGAHLDHLGKGPSADSLARDAENAVHYGADDNASGVAALLEIAEWLADRKKHGQLLQERNLVLGLWSGEELGLLGSSHFVSQFGGEIGENLQDRVAAYLNMDMVGRLRDHLILQGVGSSPFWAGEIERRNIPVGLSIRTQNDSYLPTDSTPFYLNGVPILSAFTGNHREYHTPDDIPEKINYEGLARVATFMGLMTRSLLETSELPAYVEMERPDDGGRAGLRAYLGTIPDYASGDVQGVPLAGVVGGGPAERAGVKAGDIIVELAGRQIENIYDYTYAIDALKIGETARMVVLRDGEKVSLEVVPESRE